jgi:hypothetical protein
MNRNLVIAIVVAIAAVGVYVAYNEYVTKPAAVEAAVAQKAADEAAAAKLAEEEAAKKAADEAAAALAAAEAAAAAAATLDPANFDAAAVNAMIAASTLDDATKATLKAGVDAAATNPAGVAAALQAVKAALGM